MNPNNWTWNEMQQIGTDYADLKEVAIYDERMASFRDVHQENQNLLNLLNLPKGAHVLEIGCGTGRFSRAASAAGLQATAIDVSKIMLEYVQKKCCDEKLPSIKVQNAGFLTMDFPVETFDAVVTWAALHHLPDNWKLVALQNIYNALKPEGQFILGDVVFSLADNQTPQDCFQSFINGFNDQIKEGAIGHVKKEFSTYDWIMEGLIQRAGLKIQMQQKFPVGSIILYHCRKK